MPFCFARSNKLSLSPVLVLSNPSKPVIETARRKLGNSGNLSNVSSGGLNLVTHVINFAIGATFSIKHSNSFLYFGQKGSEIALNPTKSPRNNSTGKS